MSTDLPASARIPAVVVDKISEKAKQTIDEVERFVQKRCIPADAVFEQQLGRGTRERFAAHPHILDGLKQEARRLGLWNLFLPKGPGDHGGSHTNLEYGLMAEELGRSSIASEAMNCSA